MNKIRVLMDGAYVDGEDGQSILDLARKGGVFIPTLCDLEGLPSVGACRLCMVEITGVTRLSPACTTRVRNGMQITTRSPKLDEYRRMIIELLLSERNHVCSVCVSNGHCDLQALAQKLGVDHVRFAYRHPHQVLDGSHERFRLDHNRCILCSRCVRVCSEIEGARAKDICGRGIDSMVAHDLGDAWGKSFACTNCSKCVHVCPTGALTEKGTSVAEMVKRRQFLPYLTRMRGARP